MNIVLGKVTIKYLELLTGHDTYYVGQVSASFLIEHDRLGRNRESSLW